ncbi:hypothetical protein MKZ38_001875 [Zalerion maritima]|uniref:Uncharacterized protein n=1 Tax=Zalerion maritima TaxID=339359 RepID=A0AAD5WLR5_9PEZI|nr:hypothetical protein MKZ38_001875 [Zalerion maritima]
MSNHDHTTFFSPQDLGDLDSPMVESDQLPSSPPFDEHFLDDLPDPANYFDDLPSSPPSLNQDVNDVEEEEESNLPYIPGAGLSVLNSPPPVSISSATLYVEAVEAGFEEPTIMPPPSPTSPLRAHAPRAQEKPPPTKLAYPHVIVDPKPGLWDALVYNFPTRDSNPKQVTLWLYQAVLRRRFENYLHALPPNDKTARLDGNELWDMNWRSLKARLPNLPDPMANAVVDDIVALRDEIENMDEDEKREMRRAMELVENHDDYSSSQEDTKMGEAAAELIDDIGTAGHESKKEHDTAVEKEKTVHAREDIEMGGADDTKQPEEQENYGAIVRRDFSIDKSEVVQAAVTTAITAPRQEDDSEAKNPVLPSSTANSQEVHGTAAQQHQDSVPGIATATDNHGDQASPFVPAPSTGPWMNMHFPTDPEVGTGVGGGSQSQGPSNNEGDDFNMSNIDPELEADNNTAHVQGEDGGGTSTNTSPNPTTTGSDSGDNMTPAPACSRKRWASLDATQENVVDDAKDTDETKEKEREKDEEEKEDAEAKWVYRRESSIKASPRVYEP